MPAYYLLFVNLISNSEGVLAIDSLLSITISAQRFHSQSFGYELTLKTEPRSNGVKYDYIYSIGERGQATIGTSM